MFIEALSEDSGRVFDEPNRLLLRQRRDGTLLLVDQTWVRQSWANASFIGRRMERSLCVGLQ